MKKERALGLLVNILLVIVLFLSSLSTARAEQRYTREKSKELFHLINWSEYSSDTFRMALSEKRPIFLLVSAPAWCYWCHVYESVDYLYHPSLYPYINEHFIAIFVDSDKRPDLTKKYLEGGWPSTTILAPDMSRISGFSGPRDPYAVKDFLERVVEYVRANPFDDFSYELQYEKNTPRIPKKENLKEIEEIVLSYAVNAFDKKFGGFTQGLPMPGRPTQKFPSGFLYKYLIEKYEETGDKELLNMVALTFENQYTELSEIKDGYRLYDPVEGGFHRYSTKSDWTAPHYEKMLADQAKLIRAYAHLYAVTGDDKVKKVVEGTAAFVINKLYDSEGGFYSSQDAYLEHNYYGLTGEERERIKPPYIDRTRNIDSVSMMISSFLYLYDVFREREYLDIARKSLDFIAENMIGPDGAYYYFDYVKKRPFLTGQSISNSWAMLAFIDGYEILKDDRYLQAAERIARYSLSNLYDREGGGFFERNSRDMSLYGPNENIDLSRPYRENAVFAYSMVRLYGISGDLGYLESGLKTAGFLLTRSGIPDETYYAVRALQLVEKNSLIDEYKKNEEAIDNLIKKGRKEFFLSRLFTEKKEDAPVKEPPRIKDEMFDVAFTALMVLAFMSGILSFLSPCILPVLSAYFAYGFRAGKGEIVGNTIFFFTGLAVVFSIFGMGATLAGSFLKENREVFTRVAASFIILFGLLEIFGKGFSGMKINLKGELKTHWGSFLFGSVFAIGWSACIGPILASLLLIAATAGTVVKGTSLLFIYAIGLSIPLVIVSVFFERLKTMKIWNIIAGREISFRFFGKKIGIHTTSLVSGAILISLGILIFNDYLYRLNRISLETEYVQELLIRGEEFLKNLFVK